MQYFRNINPGQRLTISIFRNLGKGKKWRKLQLINSKVTDLIIFDIVSFRNKIWYLKPSLREKCPNTDFFLVRIWTFFTQCTESVLKNNKLAKSITKTVTMNIKLINKQILIVIKNNISVQFKYGSNKMADIIV